MMDIKRKALLSLKNSIGWRTNRKIVVFSVDDYGNVRLDSSKAREKMNNAGMKIHSRFDSLDTLETKADLEMLFDALMSVKDKNGNYAIFTPFALPCNINFENVIENGYHEYAYEYLPETYSKLSLLQPEAYKGAWELWLEGINNGIFLPQFHGREHLNLRIFNEKLRNGDNDIITAIHNRSYTSIENSIFPTISYTAAYQFWDYSDNEYFKENIRDGFDAFEKVFGYKPVHFNAPGGYEHASLHKTVNELGGKYVDAQWIKKEHQGFGKYRYRMNYTGKKDDLGLTVLVRNVVFEPSDDRGFDWISYTMKQIENAFHFNRPAIISSHRVNFCGHIDENNRLTGIIALKDLLKKIQQKWPDVEFMSANELMQKVND